MTNVEYERSAHQSQTSLIQTSLKHKFFFGSEPNVHFSGFKFLKAGECFIVMVPFDFDRFNGGIIGL